MAEIHGANSIRANYISIQLRDRRKHARQRPTAFLPD